jgi:D-mannonate dehydratase
LKLATVAAATRVDTVDFIRRYADRIVFLHLRDQKADATPYSLTIRL